MHNFSISFWKHLGHLKVMFWKLTKRRIPIEQMAQKNKDNSSLSFLDKKLRNCPGKKDSLTQDLAEECLCEGLIIEKEQHFVVFLINCFENKLKR